MKIELTDKEIDVIADLLCDEIKNITNNCEEEEFKDYLEIVNSILTKFYKDDKRD